MSSGPLIDVFDEIAQTKLLWGLGSSLLVYISSLTLSWLFVPWDIRVVGIGVPVLMWFTLRWLEDMLSAARSALSILRMITLGRIRLAKLSDVREGLYERVVGVATQQMGLPRDARELCSGGEARRRWLGYFSVTRRKKKDWNEVLRLYDVTDYAE
jgi:glycerol-3-phosphate O-acyltransferase / dihydroxyacetone phosphate acyltransferase